MKRILLLWMLFVSISLSAQDWAVKTNLLYDATATINLGAEIGLAPKWTLDLSANYNGWTFNDNKKWKLAGSARSPLLAVRTFQRSLCRCPSVGRTVQLGRHQDAVRTLGEPGELPLRRLVCRRRSGLWLPVAAGKALEHRGCAGRGLCACPLRQVRVRPLR